MEPINPESLGAPRGYSNGMLAPVGARMLFVAGQIAWDAQQQVVSQDFAQQFLQALKNVMTVVEGAGSGPEHIGSLTIFVTDKRAYLNDLKNAGAAYREVMGRHYPTMALLEVAALVEDDAQVHRHVRRARVARRPAVDAQVAKA